MLIVIVLCVFEESMAAVVMPQRAPFVAMVHRICASDFNVERGNQNQTIINRYSAADPGKVAREKSLKFHIEDNHAVDLCNDLSLDQQTYD